ncbi:GNAT family N-acetyltransferase [Pararhizobium mangrovi]|uniref:N-acetyltransferase family protein n=1 Tax=Pararhizobium mangrovi TaxID=2590452 RepID=A0A506U1U6_9HYPH|nr:GNAT family N-acetyltransferase [Pararhizobium mangrovi]TPW27004.1 N-acetyltransferase family protein [Pararhizobium mangrovi]
MPSDPIIRDAGPDDLDAITRIYAEAVENGVASYELTPPDKAEMQARFDGMLEKGYPYLVAQAGDVVVGYAYANAFRTRPAYRWIVESSIYLSVDARGLGIGRVLLDALVERASALGFRQMIAVIGGAHPASIGVHRACGFTECGRMTATGYKHGRWLDTVLMQKALGDGGETPPDLDAYPGTLFTE